MDEPLFSAELSAATAAHHKASNRLVNLTAPLALSSPEVYAALLSSFSHIFAVLERELNTRRRHHPRISGVYLPSLLRFDAFQADLAYHNASPAEPTAATRAYIAEMTAAVESDPILLVAYAQTLYGGVLAGGQILREWVLRAFGGGVAIFEFQDHKALREEFRGAIDRLALSREEKNRVVEWKKKVFEANDKVFAEVRSMGPYRRRALLGWLAILILLIAILVLLRWLLGAMTK